MNLFTAFLEMNTVLSRQDSPKRALEHCGLPVPDRSARPVEGECVRCLSFLVHDHTFKRFSLAVPFNRSTGAPYSPSPGSFSNFHAVPISHNPVRLHRPHLGEGQFGIFHLWDSIFHCTERQPRCPGLRQCIGGKHKQSELDDHQLRHNCCHDLASQCFWRRLRHRRSGTTR